MEALGAYYSSKMAYAFNSGAVRGAKNKKMAQEMHTRWVNFIKNGDPNIGAAPPTAAQWPQYDPEKAEVMIFDSEVRAAPLPAVELPGERAGRRQ
jgi:carboxylesterase type B